MDFRRTDMNSSMSSIRQETERLNHERIHLLAMRESLCCMGKMGFSKQQAYEQALRMDLYFLQHGIVDPVIPVVSTAPAFRPPPGLSLSTPTKTKVGKRVHFSDDSDIASTCSGSSERVRMISGSSSESVEVLSDSDSESIEVLSDTSCLGSTTVIMRNIPNRFSHVTLAALLDNNGFSGVYDLLYLPVDYASGVSLGYAFVNLSSTEGAKRLIASFDGFNQWGGASKKVCCVVPCHDNESLSERLDRYRNLPVMHSSVPDTYKPVLYSAGQRVPFPAPTKKLRPPRSQVQGKKQLSCNISFPLEQATERVQFNLSDLYVSL